MPSALRGLFEPAPADPGPQLLPPPGARYARPLALALALLAALLAELLALEPLPGSRLSLSMAPALAAAARLGPLAGLVAALAARGPASLALGHPLALLIAALEAAFLGELRRRRPRASILLADALFWPLLGFPLLLLSYRLGLRLSGEAALLLLLRAWILGLLNAYLAELLADSRLAGRLLGSAPARRDLGAFVRGRVSLVLLPIALLGLLGTALAFRPRIEGELERRLRAGLERARCRIEASGPGAEAAAVAAALNARPIDPEGRYELAEPGAGLPRPWREGLFELLPAGRRHPTEAWREAEYFGELPLGEARLRFLLPYAPFFRELSLLSALALGAFLGLLYAVYLLVGLAGAALGSRARSLLEAAQALPERIERGEELAWPRLELDEFARLAEEFRSVSLRLRRLFETIRSSCDGLEEEVSERTAELEGRTEEVRRLLAQVEREREEERARVARELHDEFGQDIAGLGMGLYILERRLGGAGEAAAETLEDLRGLLEELTEGMRRIVADLRPGALDHLRLADALAGLARERRERSGLGISFSSSLPEGFELPAETTTAAFRVAQAALSNALRHSGSSRVALSLDIEEDFLALSVEDWGRGFDPAKAGGPGSGSFGLLGMRERCRALGGRLEIRSAPGEGSLLRAYFPLEERSP